MKLEFTPEYLDELEKFSKKYYLSKKVLFQRIEEALEKADESDISYALKNGLLSCESCEYDSYKVEDYGAGFQMIIAFDYLRKRDCTNWKEYFSHRLKEFKDKE